MSIDTLDTRENAEHVLDRGPVVVPTREHHETASCAHPAVPACGHPAPAADEPAPPAVVRPALLAGEEHEAPDPWIFRGTD
ncbi:MULTISPECIES: hypothetical protein [unclassified Streptomyces]|uniref:hypothetical protein n=1 Tax=unclassified Streptomyces TaxID=2593676 RepID=UPI0035DD640C